MTNIMAFKGTDGKPNKKDLRQFIFLCSDSMGTSGDTKQDVYQKLMKIGDSSIALGTGTSNALYQMVESLRKQGDPEDADQLARKAIELGEQMQLDYISNPLNLIIGTRGKDKGLSLRQIYASGYTKDGKLVTDSQGKLTRPIIEAAYNAFDGSGATEVIPLLNSSNFQGTPMLPNSLANCMLLCYALGKKGAFNTGVNQNLQYGIIGQDRTVTLFHPEVNLVNGDLETYLKDTFGKEFPPLWQKGEKKGRERSYERDALKRVVDAYYTAIERELTTLFDRQRDFNHASTQYGNQNISLATLSFIRDQLIRNKEYVQQGVEALLGKDPQRLVEYRQQSSQRMADVEQKVLNLVKP